MTNDTNMSVADEESLFSDEELFANGKPINVFFFFIEQFCSLYVLIRVLFGTKKNVRNYFSFNDLFWLTLIVCYECISFVTEAFIFAYCQNVRCTHTLLYYLATQRKRFTVVVRY